MKYSRQEKIYEIGEAIFPTDMSSLHRKDGDTCFIDAHYDELMVRERLRRGYPLIVVSEPYAKRDIGWFELEWYIDVMFSDSDCVYSIFNSDCNVFTDYLAQMEFIDDCEACAELGY